MTISTLFGVVLAAVERSQGDSGRAPDDAPRNDERRSAAPALTGGSGARVVSSGGDAARSLLP